MTRFLLVSALLLGGAALAGGVVQLVHVDPDGEVEFAPRVDTAALGWWLDRAKSVAESGSTLDEAARFDPR